MINEDQLREEIEFLKKALDTSRKLAALPHPKKDQDISCMPEKYSPRITLLMNWINAVGAYYGVKVCKVVKNDLILLSVFKAGCLVLH